MADENSEYIVPGQRIVRRENNGNVVTVDDGISTSAASYTEWHYSPYGDPIALMLVLNIPDIPEKELVEQKPEFRAKE